MHRNPRARRKCIRSRRSPFNICQLGHDQQRLVLSNLVSPTKQNAPPHLFFFFFGEKENGLIFYVDGMLPRFRDRDLRNLLSITSNENNTTCGCFDFVSCFVLCLRTFHIVGFLGLHACIMSFLNNNSTYLSSY